ncbi:MAG: threonine synthase [Ignavibacteriae bacterium]|nr:threonine synthase [Ignavibacteriota bacterium]
MNIPLTFLTHLECSVCGDRHSPHELQAVCRSCGKSLLARYDLQAAKSQFLSEHLKSKAPSMWRYLPVLPIERETNIVSLGEGMTPLVPLRKIGDELGLSNLWMKDEGQLPTGSFKARGLAMAISKAKELGVRAVCMPTAGNAGGAAAAYAARAGLQSIIFMPEDTPEINIKESIVYGAQVELVKGNISDAAKVMNEKKQKGWFDVSTLKEPYRLEGKKTMGYELAEQFDWELPDVVLYPTGGGTGLIGMWKAFDEMEQLGWINSRRPRMISVQAAGCAPIVKAFQEQKSESEFWQNAQTVASGLRVPKAFADHLILKAVYDSNGSAVAVKDEELLVAMREIAQKEGLFICPEGAATLVALKKLLAENFVTPDETILLFNTGAGIKYPELVKRS